MRLRARLLNTMYRVWEGQYIITPGMTHAPADLRLIVVPEGRLLSSVRIPLKRPQRNLRISPPFDG